LPWSLRTPQRRPPSGGDPQCDPARIFLFFSFFHLRHRELMVFFLFLITPLHTSFPLPLRSPSGFNFPDLPPEFLLQRTLQDQRLSIPFRGGPSPTASKLQRRPDPGAGFTCSPPAAQTRLQTCAFGHDLLSRVCGRSSILPESSVFS